MSSERKARHLDTTLGGSKNRFPLTTMGFLGRLLDSHHPDYQQGLETLCQRYWKPIYCYLRIAWAKSNEEAKDLTQAFFLWLLENEVLAKFDAARGRFRAYLKVVLRSFVSHQDQALRSLKRGEGKRIFSLDQEGPGLEELVPDPRAADPEKVFDQLWACELVNRAFSRLRQRLLSAGRETSLRIYEAYTASGDKATYTDLAAQFKVTAGQVDTHLRLVRDELRREIRRELADVTSGDADLEAEWRELIGREI